MECLLPAPARLVSYSKPSSQDVALFYMDPLLWPYWDVLIYLFWDFLLGFTLQFAIYGSNHFLFHLEADLCVANDLLEAPACLPNLSALLICTHKAPLVLFLGQRYLV